jgi:hypothetical protein
MFRAKSANFSDRRKASLRWSENEDWLANNFDKIIHSQGIAPQDDDAEKCTARRTVAENEEHILRCLGAAVIMQWNTIPAARGSRPVVPHRGDRIACLGSLLLLLGAVGNRFDYFGGKRSLPT